MRSCCILLTPHEGPSLSGILSILLLTAAPSGAVIPAAGAGCTVPFLLQEVVVPSESCTEWECFSWLCECEQCEFWSVCESCTEFECLSMWCEWCWCEWFTGCDCERCREGICGRPPAAAVSFQTGLGGTVGLAFLSWSSPTLQVSWEAVEFSADDSVLKL